jgi:DNA-binding SARP family transcriptional activator
LLEFRILGPLEVVGDDGPLLLGGRKQRAVLAILLLNANRVVPIDRLADELYGDAMPASALTQIQVQISQLRRLLDPDHPAGAPGSLIETRAPGYLIRLASEQLDLRRFERAGAEAAEAATRGDPAASARRLSDALELWRGPPLADFAGDSFAQSAIARLEEMRLGALERRLDAEFALGKHAELVGELEALAIEYPLRERFHGQLMLALYRSGRQAEALAVYRRTREALVDQLGIEPGPALQELERAILMQQRSLDLDRPAPTTAEPARTVLVVALNDASLDALLTVAEPLAGPPRRGELILACPVADEGGLAAAAAAANARRRGLCAPARAASFISSEPGRDIVRLSTLYDIDLVLVDSRGRLEGDRLPGDLADILERSPAHVAVLAGPGVDIGSGSKLCVPFGGGEHDWAALELAAWLASSVGVPITLVGTRAVPERRQADASRLLADAALAVQRLVDVDATPVLAEPTEDALLDAVAGASLVVVGISPRWARDGIGATRRALVRTGAPILLVHRGPRPSGMAPRETGTRFTWSLQT